MCEFVGGVVLLLLNWRRERERDFSKDYLLHTTYLTSVLTLREIDFQ